MGKTNKHCLIRLSVLLLVLLITFLTISGRGCHKRKRSNNDNVVSSEWAGIAAPTNLSAIADSLSGIDLSWTDNSFNEDGFEIWRSLDASNFQLLTLGGSNINTYYDSGLLPYTTYYYKVRAYMGSEMSGYSNVASAVTFDYSWLPPFTAVAAGNNHTLALASNGNVWIWGNNDYSQLGIGGSDSYRIIPTLIEIDWFGEVFNGITAITAGGIHTIARKTNNTLWTWGNGTYGQLGSGDNYTYDGPYSVIGSDSDWSFVAAGIYHTVGLKTNSTLWTWGNNDAGQLGLNDVTITRTTPTSVGTASDWSQVAAGDYFSFGIKSIGTLWAWGRNDSGQLGLGDSTNRNTPTSVGAASDWSRITTGASHTIGLKNNGTIWAWGYNNSGQLGLGNIGISRTTPTSVGTASDWSQISAGDYFSLGIKSNDTLWAWGANSSCQLGSGDQISRNTPTSIGTASDWSRIASGNSHNIGLKSNGTIWTWGTNSSGQLGLSDQNYRNIPCRLGSPKPPSLSLTVISSSQVNLSWLNLTNELGFQIERKISGTPYSLLATVGPNITSYPDTGLSTGVTYYYRMKAYNAYGESPYSNEVNAVPILLPPTELIGQIISSTRIDLSWINNAPDADEVKIERKSVRYGTYAQIGTTSADITGYSDITSGGFAPNTYYYYRVKAWNPLTESTYSNEATFIMGSGNWTNVTSKGAHSIGIKNSNTLWVWGENKNGQLGLGDVLTNRDTPTSVGTVSDWSQIAAGSAHSIIIKTNRTLWTWGSNSSGQLGLGDAIERNTPTYVETNSDWSKIAAGDTHTFGIKTNGVLWAWGDNSFGQLGLGDTKDNRYTPASIGNTSDWIQLTAGKSFTLGLKNNGTLWAWGDNSFGQLGLGDTTNRNTPASIGNTSDWSQITAGSAHALGIKNNGTLWAWGNNSGDQLGLGDPNERTTPSPIGIDSDWSWITTGDSHTLGIKNNRTLWAWGRNDSGQLGLGDNSKTPAQIGTDSDWSWITAGASYTLGIKNNRTLWAWGANSSGQLGLGDSLDRSVPTLVGE